jgi:hypothetical protein
MSFEAMSSPSARPVVSEGAPALRRRATIIGGLVLLAAYLSHVLAAGYSADDGYISMQYVKNFVSGHGLVYHSGERVEGYTGFLWVFLLGSVKLLVPRLDLPTLANVLGITFGAATIVLTLWLSRRLRPDRPWLSLLAPAFLACHSGLAAWATGGLETTMFAFLVIAGVVCHVGHLRGRHRYWAAAPVIFAVATMTRPDGVLFFGLTALHLTFGEWRRTRRLPIARAAACAAIFLLVYGPYYAWRFLYYGYPLPNTFYAKVGAGFYQYARGVKYLASYARWYGLLHFLPLLVMIVAARRVAWRDYLALIVAGYAAYVVYVGGDGLAFFRFITYIAAPLYLLVQEGLIETWDWLRPRLLPAAVPAVTVACAALVAGSLLLTGRMTFTPLLLPQRAAWFEPHCELWFPGNHEAQPYVFFDNYFVARQAVAARWLEAHLPPGSLVASTPAGSIAYHMNLPVLDMLGLNDLHIAHSKSVARGAHGRGRAGHEKGDGPYVLSRKPAVILMGNVAVLPFPLNHDRMARKLVLKSEHELWALDEFHREYELFAVPLPDAGDGPLRYFSFYKRRGVPFTGDALDADVTNIYPGADAHASPTEAPATPHPFGSATLTHGSSS